MQSNYGKCLAWVLEHEGGYVDHPRDPGGATNKGITQRVYDGFRSRTGLGERSVKFISDEEVATIYAKQYWEVVGAGVLPSGIDYAVFDFAVNSGPHRAVQFLQRELGVKADGIVGNVTISTSNDANAEAVCVGICDARLAWLKRLSHWSTFGRGWSRRVANVKDRSRAMARGARPAVETEQSPPALYQPTDDRMSATAQGKENIGKMIAGSAGSLATGATVLADSDSFILQGTLAAVILAAVGFFLFVSWKSHTDE